jgi:hypothetical protein
MSKLTVHVGGARDMGRRFAAAFNRAQAGENLEERHVTFLSLEEMLAALSPKRLEMLRHLHRESAESVKALATALDRDYKRVGRTARHAESVQPAPVSGRFAGTGARVGADRQNTAGNPARAEQQPATVQRTYGPSDCPRHTRQALHDPQKGEGIHNERGKRRGKPRDASPTGPGATVRTAHMRISRVRKERSLPSLQAHFGVGEELEHRCAYENSSVFMATLDILCHFGHV